jgi:FkbM family methyltransferase
MRRGVLNLQLRWFCSVPLVTAWTFLQALLWSQTQAPNSFLDCSRPQNSDGPVSILLAAKEATTVKQLWLESCSQDHKKVIQFQLPPNRCRLTEKNAWQNRCSFSYATRCPEPAWLRKAEETLLSPDRDFAKKLERKGPVAIYVGCNKGMDAVNTLRMLSSSPVIDKNIWRDALVESSRSANRTIHVGHCNQEYASQYALPTGLATAVTTTSQSTPQVINARVFCIEAMPNSAEQLQQTTHHLGWEKSLIVTNAAIAAADGTARFPHRQVGKIVGVESLGLATCQTPGQKRFCTNVPQYKLDTFVRTVVDDFSESYFATPIDFLTIDVEGFDWDVLLGANDTLRRVKYLEFEYNWKGE